MAPQKADVLFTWFSSSDRLKAAMGAFKRPTVVIEMPAGFVVGPDIDPKTKKPKQHSRNYDAELAAHGKSPLRAICKDKGIEPLRVAVLGFSQGCQGVRAALRGGEGARIDSMIAVDGTHSSYVRMPTKTEPGTFSPEAALPYAAFGRLAMTKGRLGVITTSSIRPGGSVVSTTDISNWIWREVTGGDVDQEDRPAPDGVLFHVESVPAKIKFQCLREITYVEGVSYRYRNKGGLTIINYADLDPTGCADHIYQAQYVLPLMVERYLAARWNTQPPSEGICLVSGPGWSEPLPSLPANEDGSCEAGYTVAPDGSCKPLKACGPGTHLVVDEETYPDRPDGVCVANAPEACGHPELLGPDDSAAGAGDALILPDVGEEAAIPHAANDPGPKGLPGAFPRDKPAQSSVLPFFLAGLLATVVAVAVGRSARPGRLGSSMDTATTSSITAAFLSQGITGAVALLFAVLAYKKDQRVEELQNQRVVDAKAGADTISQMAQRLTQLTDQQAKQIDRLIEKKDVK